MGLGLIRDSIGPGASVESRIAEWQRVGKLEQRWGEESLSIMRKYGGKPSFGQFLKEVRVRKGLSQDQIAEDVGVSRVMIGKYERGDAMPGAAVMVSYLLAIPAMMSYIRTIWPPDEWREEVMPSLSVWYKRDN